MDGGWGGVEEGVSRDLGEGGGERDHCSCCMLVVLVRLSGRGVII